MAQRHRAPQRRNGLTASHVFRFGNLVGETGGNGTLAVNASDLMATRAAINGARAMLRNRYDHNRDGRVNAADYAIARAAEGRTLAMLTPAAAARVVRVRPGADRTNHARCITRASYEGLATCSPRVPATDTARAAAAARSVARRPPRSAAARPPATAGRSIWRPIGSPAAS